MPNGHIYKITNTINGDTYIGKTTKSVSERFTKHKYNSKKGQTYLARAMRKYGPEKFVVETLEQTERLDEREIELISQHNPTYNMTKGGEGGDTSNSPNFIAAMKEMHSKRKPSDYATYGMLGKKSPAKGGRQPSKYKAVMCEGKRFDSIRDAQEAYPKCNLRKRLDNPRFPDFYRL